MCQLVSDDPTSSQPSKPLTNDPGPAGGGGDGGSGGDGGASHGTGSRRVAPGVDGTINTAASRGGNGHEIAEAAAHGCCTGMAFMLVFNVVGAGLRAIFGPFFGSILAAGAAGAAVSGGSTAMAQRRRR